MNEPAVKACLCRDTSIVSGLHPEYTPRVLYYATSNLATRINLPHRCTLNNCLHEFISSCIRTFCCETTSYAMLFRHASELHLLLPQTNHKHSAALYLGKYTLRNWIDKTPVQNKNSFSFCRRRIIPLSDISHTQFGTIILFLLKLSQSSV